MLGVAYTVIGKMDEAARVYRDWLADTPDDPVARHLYAACTGEGVPERAQDDYIQTTFDSFADSFDAKLETLNYRAPELIARAFGEALARPNSRPSRRLRCLDAGCGTGLCGVLIASRVHHLTGVDLSANMLERARRHSVYDELVRSELTEYLESRQGAFDLIVSADTLVYFGALERVIGAAALALRSAGNLIFTVEDAGEIGSAAGYRIQPHGRYAHARDYVERVIVDAALELMAVEPEILRKEAGKPVAGLLVSARRTQPRAKRRAGLPSAGSDSHGRDC
jgi:predicted TPR repeat methyltransferase